MFTAGAVAAADWLAGSPVELIGLLAIPPVIAAASAAVPKTGTVGASPALADLDARLAAGDSLVLYTDGMIESQDRTDGNGPNWLASQLAEMAGEGAEEIADRLARAAISRQGGEPRDDIAVLVLHRRG